MKKLLFLALAASGLVHAAGTVSMSITGPLGQTQNYVAAFNWTGDSVTGSVPVTPALGITPLQGYLIFGVEVKPGTPAPINGYNVAITDFVGVDQLGGAGNNLSSTTASGFNASANTQPINGTFNLVITGNSVAGAQGIVYVYFGAVNSTTLAGRTSGTALGVAGGDLTGAYPNPFLVTTGIMAATYGSATQVPQCTFDSKGRATGCGNVLITPAFSSLTGTIATGQLGGTVGGDLVGTLPNPTLATDGVTAGTYGSATQVPQCTFDAKGRAATWFTSRSRRRRAKPWLG